MEDFFKDIFYYSRRSNDPIYSGKHEGEWNLCIDCHLGNNYSDFSCIDCHEHDNQADVDDDHDGVSGYVYNSDACFSCHPTGEAD